MTPAEFKTRRQGLWLSDSDLATRLGVADARTIRYWESGRNDIPDRAVKELLEIETLVKTAADMSISFIRNKKPKQVALVRYRSEADMPGNEVANFGFPAHKLHANTLHRIMTALPDIVIGIVYFDHEKYRHWLNGRKDAPDLRAEWAAKSLI